MMLQLLRLAEKVYAVLALLVFTDAGVRTLRYATGTQDLDAEYTDARLAALFYLVYLTTTALLALRWKSLPGIAIRALPLWTLMALALNSVLWSTVPDRTLRSSIALLGTTLFGIYLATRYTLQDQLKIVASAMGIIAFLSVYFVVFDPFVGISGPPHEGTWRGAYSHKNGLGRGMVVCAIVFLLLGSTIRRYRWVAWSGALFGTALVLLTNSRTALLILTTLVAVLSLCRILRWHYSFAAPLLIAGTAVSSYAALWLGTNFEPVLDSLGRDVTLTGRTELWGSVYELIQERPLLGYGYDGFWLGWDGPSAEVWLQTGWDPPHAHNGYLDLWATLGIVGLVVFVLGFAWAYVKASFLIIRDQSMASFWPVIYLTFILIYNVTESTILKTNSIYWVLYVCTYVTMIVEPMRRTRKAVAGRGAREPSGGGKRWAKSLP